MRLTHSLRKDDEEHKASVQFLKDVFGLFMVNQKSLDKNLWMLSQRSEGGLPLSRLEKLPYWRYEQFVSIANEIAEEEKKDREKQESDQNKSSGSNFKPGNYLNKMSSMANKFKS